MVKEKLKKTQKKLREESKKHTTTAIIAAFSFLLAFTWRDLIQRYVDHIVNNFAITGPDYLIQLYATILITLICVLGIILVTKYSQNKEKEQQKK
jgi:polyferredoxin